MKSTANPCLKRRSPLLVLFLSGLLIPGNASAEEFLVASPDGTITATLSFDEDAGTVSYAVKSKDTEIITASPMGIETSRGDFRSDMKFQSVERETVDEKYSLPQGKTSSYHNHANELVLQFRREEQEMHLRFRAYDDGVAFSFAIPGEGEITLAGEGSAIHLGGSDLTYFGQNHPNRYGYESALGPVTGERMSNAVLAHLKDRNHFVLMGQAATSGSYVQTHFQRDGSKFSYQFPLDQEALGPVRTTLPFQSPWRMIIISPEDAGGIVESHLVENLNPPTHPDLLDAEGKVKDWIKPGRVMWDFIAGDGDKPRMWIDATAEMGWEYYMADAGFARRFGGDDAVREAAEYATGKGVGLIGWAHTREFDTPEKAAEIMSRYASWGLKGAKIDFFDHNTSDENPREWRDYEDTQRSLQMRDWIFKLGIEHQFLLELHGNTIPTGERRQYPHLMTLEGVDGMERKTKPAANDLTIPFVRNVMGPVSYTIIHFDRSPGTHAYQMAMSVIYEAGMMIYAEHGRKLLSWPGREMIKDVPSAWDETRFIEGYPGSHLITARRKGEDWFVGGMTDAARTAELPLDFLPTGASYQALIFRDGDNREMTRETRAVSAADKLSLKLLERGGFAIRLSPEK